MLLCRPSDSQSQEVLWRSSRKPFKLQQPLVAKYDTYFSRDGRPRLPPPDLAQAYVDMCTLLHVPYPQTVICEHIMRHIGGRIPRDEEFPGKRRARAQELPKPGRGRNPANEKVLQEHAGLRRMPGTKGVEGSRNPHVARSPPEV